MSFNTISLPDILARLKIAALNPMQEAALEANKQEGDVVLLSNTGTGKTLAFLLPVLEQLQENITGTQALVVVPSRELAQQIETVWRTMRTGAKVTLCYGGHKREIEEKNLLQAPQLIIGTPGRLTDHLRRGNIQANTIHTLVLDEYDKCLELGFAEEINEVLGYLQRLQRRILVSATPPNYLPANMQLENHQTLNFIVAEPDNILETRYVSCTELDKLKDLFLLLCMVGDRSCIVFCNHRDAVARTANYLSTNGIACVYYHGALEQPERELALAKFRNGSVRTLITTDLAARGLDIPNIRYIIHYHLPHTEESYTHRNGRTARMDKSGTIVLLKGPQETLPTFVGPDAEALELAENPPIPERPQMVTLYLGTGKKDKINKIDIVGFLTNKAQLASDDIGFIEVKDFTAFVAIRRKKVHLVLPRIEQEKIKGRKVKFQIL